MSSSSTSASERRARAGAFARYLGLVALIVGLLAAGFLALVADAYGVRIKTPPDEVAARLLAKMRRAAAVEGPRILVFAGSQAFYNVRAKAIEEATGRPSVNLGTHGSQSLPFLQWQVEHVARAGDIVLLPLEHSFYTDGGLTTYGVRIAHAAGLPLFRALPPGEKLQYLRELHLPRLLRALAARLGLSPGLKPSDLALRVTPRGDVVHGPQQRRLLADAIARSAASRLLPPPAGEAGTRLRALAGWARTHGVTLLLAPPGIMDALAPTAAERHRFAVAVEALGAGYLELPRGGAIPSEMMMDTSYHAGRAGALLYTSSIVVALCEDARLGLSCDGKRLAAARRILARTAAHGAVFGDDPRLAALQRNGLRLKAGETVRFAVATFRHCDDRLEVDGSGRLSLRVGGRSHDLDLSRGHASVALPDLRSTLVEASVAAGDGGARLRRLERVSDCEGRRPARRRALSSP